MGATGPTREERAPLLVLGEGRGRLGTDQFRGGGTHLSVAHTPSPHPIFKHPSETPPDMVERYEDGRWSCTEQYQDEWVRGERVSAGVRDCASRYEIIREFASQFNRPFTVLDIGANLGYHSFRLMEDFDCVSVMIEGPVYHASLYELAERNDSGVILYHQCNQESLRALAEVEHFDLVLALSVVHHIRGDVNETCEIIRDLGDYAIFEIADEKAACGQDRVRAIDVGRDWTPIGKGKSHLADSERTIYLTHRPKTKLDRRYWTCNLPSTIRISSGFDAKHLSFTSKPERRDWIRGINLATFRAFGGSWPQKSDLLRWLDATDTDSLHGDIRPWNFIVTGENLELIDREDPRHTEITDDAMSIQAVKDWMMKMNHRLLMSR